MKTIFNDLVKYHNTFKSFVEWYNNMYAKTDNPDVNEFLMQPFAFQIGNIINYLDDTHNLGIHADDSTYIIYYIRVNDFKAVALVKKKGNNLLIENYSDNTTSIFANYRKGIIKAFAHVETPF